MRPNTREVGMREVDLTLAAPVSGKVLLLDIAPARRYVRRLVTNKVASMGERKRAAGLAVRGRHGKRQASLMVAPGTLSEMARKD